MKENTKIIILFIAVLLTYYWGCNYREKASKYKGMYNKNEFIINYLIDNKEVDVKDIKKATLEYEDYQLGILQDDSPGGQGY